jgi:hypothetical protein
MTAHYDRLHDRIMALHDEVDRARILNRPDAPPLQAPQLALLDDFADSRPHLFRKKLRVNPEIFDDILDQISGHHIFTNQSNNPQLPVALQLAIFLNRAGHYGNAISPEDVCQWAGVSVGSVINCTNRVMVALLDQHDAFISFPTVDSEDTELARKYSQSKTCPEWRNGILALDGTAIDLYTKPGLFGEAFYDRKSRYSISCQVSVFFHFSDNKNLNLNHRQLLCPTTLGLLTIALATLAVHTMHMPSTPSVFILSMQPFFLMAIGSGLTVHIHLTHGVLHLSLPSL